MKASFYNLSAKLLAGVIALEPRRDKKFQSLEITGAQTSNHWKILFIALGTFFNKTQITRSRH